MLDDLEDPKIEIAWIQVHLVQLSKALHQVGLDGGSWENALGYLLYSDPIGRLVFAGDELELECSSQCRKARKELLTIANPRGPGEKPPGDPKDQPKGGGRGKGNDK